MSKELITYLSQFISESRWTKFNTVVQQRTRHLCIVLEDIYQAHNASAVLRSCDCFGVQDVHIIENRNNYKVNPDVALGSSQWVNLYKYNKEEDNTRACLQHLKNKGYKIVATSPHEDGSSDIAKGTGKRTNYEISKLPLDQPIALVFGTELKGISDTVIEMADEFVRIPMYGFTESFNISVSAALSLCELTTRIRASKKIQWQLNQEEIDTILLQWLKGSLTRADLLEEEFNKTGK